MHGDRQYTGLTRRAILLQWWHAEIEMVGGTGGRAGKTGDLSLFIQGGGSALCVR
jgi:hypothetical protein